MVLKIIIKCVLLLLLLTINQVLAINRIRDKKFYLNYDDAAVPSQKVCTGTSSLFSSNFDDYLKWESIYKHCVYVDGNLEITNFHPFFNASLDEFSPNDEYHMHDEMLDRKYDFSFLDDIKEITGYLLISATRIKTLRLKNLKLIRGKTLINGKYSVFIDSNVRLQSLDMVNLKEIQMGSVYIKDNPKLCHMDEVNWKDITIDSKILNHTPLLTIDSNANPSTCPKCLHTCCQDSFTANAVSTQLQTSTKEKCGCWFPNGCQNLTKQICDVRCNGRCYGPGPYDCCNEQCSAGCTGPNKNDCIACKRFRVFTTGECVESCPRLQIADPHTHEITLNPNGMYQYGITCVKTCPGNLFIYQEFCLSKCPNQTYEDEELINNPETGEKGLRRVCKPCTPQKCQKTCYIEKIDKKSKDVELQKKHLKNLENCEVLNSNLMILQPDEDLNNYDEISPELNEKDLEVLQTLKIVNGYVRIQLSSRFKNLNFLKNLEVIRASNLVHSRFSLIIISKSLKTLGLSKLKTIEKGDVYIKTETLCLHNTVNWTSILNKKNSITFDNKTIEYAKNNCEKTGFFCDPACDGCWSTGPNACQFCKTFKLDDTCLETCETNMVNNKYLYLANNETRECDYCHDECKFGCSGVSDLDCFECRNYKMYINDTSFKCVNSCPITHYKDPMNNLCLPCYKDCYGCSGPGKTIETDGCTKCSSALVDNDSSFSILKCIVLDEFNCSNNYFIDLVPKNFENHPLKGKAVCRKCKDECQSCYKYGDLLNTDCESCKHFVSKSTNKCVFNCTSHNEYIEPNTNNCLSCNNECKSGCVGPGAYQCHDCRANKIHLSGLEDIINEQLAKQKLSININDEDDAEYLLASNDQNVLERSSSNSLEIKKRILHELIERNEVDVFDNFYIFNQLVKNYIEYLEANKTDRNQSEDIYFCINECPFQMPFKTKNNFCSKNGESNNFILILIFIVVSIIVIILSLGLSFLTYTIKERKHRIQKENEEKLFALNNYTDEDYDNSSDDLNKNLNMYELSLVTSDELELLRELGKGAFGTVHEGNYIPKNLNQKFKVAIKVLNKIKVVEEKAKELNDEFLEEAKLMAKVKHKYCMQLMALCIAEPIMIVTQLMPNGSVVSFFQTQREKVNEKILLIWSHQIAEGMEYLESRKIVHRDLAARNILIQNNYHIKIADFGLARIIQSNENCFKSLTSTQLPIKWLAIESICGDRGERKFDHKSDVWSYGICLWELFTFCAKPYAEITETYDLITRIRNGVRLSRPQMASVDVYILLLKCWVENPMLRPTFTELKNEFNKMVKYPKSYLDIQNVDPSKKYSTINENSAELLKKFLADTSDPSNVFYDDDDVNKSNNTDSASISVSGSGSGRGSGVSSEIGSKSDEEKEERQTNKSSSNSISFKRKVKKKKSKSRSTKLSSPEDEGIDMNSFELASSVGNASNILMSTTFSSNRCSVISQKNTHRPGSNSSHRDSKIITFKRMNNLNEFKEVDEEEEEYDESRNVHRANVNEENEMARNEHQTLEHANETKFVKRFNKNMKSLKNIFFLNIAKNAPKRLESQVSTTTTSTYMSSLYSSNGNNGESSPRILSNNYDDEPVKRERRNTEQQDFASPLNHSQFLFTPLLTPSRSNSNSSDSNLSSNGLKNLSNNSFNNNNRYSNSDYLEPVTHNIRQNFEYFGDTTSLSISNRNNKQTPQAPPIIIVSDQDNHVTNNYYNDDITNMFFELGNNNYNNNNNINKKSTNKM